MWGRFPTRFLEERARKHASRCVARNKKTQQKNTLGKIIYISQKKKDLERVEGGVGDEKEEDGGGVCAFGVEREVAAQLAYDPTTVSICRFRSLYLSRFKSDSDL